MAYDHNLLIYPSLKSSYYYVPQLTGYDNDTIRYVLLVYYAVYRVLYTVISGSNGGLINLFVLEVSQYAFLTFGN